MSFAHTLSITYATGGGATLSTTNAFTDTGNEGLSTTVPNATTNQPANISFLHADLVSVYLYSSTALTIKTNSTSAPADTIVLPAGLPVLWNSTAGGASPFTADVTAMYLTNTTSGAATVEFRFLLHS